jgi:hypothetical protein
VWITLIYLSLATLSSAATQNVNVRRSTLFSDAGLMAGFRSNARLFASPMTQFDDNNWLFAAPCQV